MTHGVEMYLRRCLAWVAAILAIGACAVPAAAQVDEAAVRECIINNGPRFDVPDRAVEEQYIDVEAACRSALSGAGGPSVVVEPGGAASPSGGDAPAASPGGSAVARDASPDPSPSGRPDGGADTGDAAPAGGDGAGPSGPSSAPRTGDGDTASADDPSAIVRDALARGDADVASPVSGLGALPAWTIALLVALVVAVIAGLSLQVRRGRGTGGDAS